MRRGRLAGPWHFAGDLRRYRNDVWPLVGPIVAAIERFQPAIVHLNDNLSLSRPGVIAAWRAGLALAICHCRSFDPPVALDRWLLAPWLAGLIYISQAVAQQQSAAWVTDAAAAVLYPQCRRPGRVDFPGDSQALRTELGVPPEALLVGSLGRITAWKGQHIFIDALAC